jgi:U3 small nucleolar RNA-associated protein 12
VRMIVSQVWGMVLLDQESRLLTGSADSELRAWDINYLSQVDLNASL